MKKIVVVAVLAALVALPFTASAGLLKAGMPHVPFELKADDGSMVKSSDIIGKGKVVVLNFMNTVCSTCAAELKDLEKVQAENANIAIYPIAVDMRGEKSVLPYKENSKYTFTFLLDSDFSVGRKYGASYTPFSIVIDKEGNVKEIIGGYNEDAKSRLEKALK